MNPEITLIEYDTTPHLRLRVDCAPYGKRDLLCESEGRDTEDIRTFLTRLAPQWPAYWTKILGAVEELFRTYQVRDFFTDTDFRLVLCQSGGWVDDDFFFEVRFEGDGGYWAVFFKDGKVIHAQFAG